MVIIIKIITWVKIKMLKICALNESSSETDSDNEQVKYCDVLINFLDERDEWWSCLDSGGDQRGSRGWASGPLQHRSEAYDREQEIYCKVF